MTPQPGYEQLDLAEMRYRIGQAIEAAQQGKRGDVDYFLREARLELLSAGIDKYREEYNQGVAEVNAALQEKFGDE